MRHVRVITVTIIILAFFGATVYAQEDISTFITSGGLEFTYPSGFAVQTENAPYAVTLSNNPDIRAFVVIAASPSFEEIYVYDQTDSSSIEEAAPRFIELWWDQFGNGDGPVLEDRIEVDDGEINYAVYNTPFSAAGYAIWTLEDRRQIAIRFTKMSGMPMTDEELLDLMLNILTSATYEQVESVTDGTPEGAVLVSDMPAGILQFGNGASLEYPEGWTISTAVEPHVTDFAMIDELPDSTGIFVIVETIPTADESIEEFKSGRLSTAIKTLLRITDESLEPLTLLKSVEMQDERMIEYVDPTLRPPGSYTESPYITAVFIVPLNDEFWGVINIGGKLDEWLRIESIGLAMSESFRID